MTVRPAHSVSFRSGLQIDMPLLMGSVAIATLGVVNLYSATSAYLGADQRAGLADIYVSQIYWIVVGFLFGILVAAIDYRHFEALGGRRRPRPDSPNAGLTSDQFRGYADYMDTPEFDTAVAALLELADAAPTAVMCAEALPWRCHRSLLADVLVARGHEVVHLIGNAQKRHQPTPAARIEDGRVTYPALL